MMNGLYGGRAGLAKVLLVALVFVVTFSSFDQESKEASLLRRGNTITSVWVPGGGLIDRFEGMRASDSKSSRSGLAAFLRDPSTVKPPTYVRASSLPYRFAGDFIENEMSETFIGHKLSNQTDAMRRKEENVMARVFASLDDEPLECIVRIANWLFQVAQAWDDNLAVTDEGRHSLDRWLSTKPDGISVAQDLDTSPLIQYNAVLGKFFFSAPKSKRDLAPMSDFAEATEVVRQNKSSRRSSITFVKDMVANFVRTREISGPKAGELLRLAEKKNLSLESWQHLLVVTLGVTDGQASLAKFAQSWRRIKASDVQAFKTQSIEGQLETLASISGLLDQLALACEESPYFNILFRDAFYVFLISPSTK
ncbi:Hypothetical Protein FCC1311_099362 [Hondaea fermentalgiana]|uniref:Uncharacterized protein n=1 Tax=Hondaea fermentalgiana TaxID=2315210 RepID=A0A2R5GYB6_9STRA|nr:Hypothetical Protein FCC1311_099362 [Hondaea fermentalgiana]|eukprot:GBG33713.1 Hypothetical Protein FCC1311_099362 [Hondaea fermentalgiana]